MHITKWKKPIWKGYILYEFNYMTFCKMQNYDNRQEKNQWLLGVRGRGMTRLNIEEF